MSTAPVGLPEWPDDSSIATTPAYDLPCAFPNDSPDSESTGVIHHATEGYLVTDRPDLVKRLVEGVGSKAVSLASAVSNYWYGRTRLSPTANSARTTINGERQASNVAPSSYPRQNRHNMNVSLVVLSSLVLAPAAWSFSLSSRPLDMRLRVFAGLTMIYSLLAVIDQSSPSQSPFSGPTLKDQVKGKVADVAIIPATVVTPVSEPAQIPESEPVYPPATSQDESETVAASAAEDIPASEPAPASASVAPPPAPEPPEKDDARETPTDATLAEGAHNGDAAPVSHETEARSSEVPAISVSEGTGKGDETVISSPTTIASPDISEDPALTPVAPSTPSKAIGSIDRSYHPAELHPRNASYSSPSFSPSATTLHSNNTSPSSSMKEKGHSYFRKRTISNYSTASQESGSVRGRKKVGFFDKVRGEAKVIVGRLEHKKEKVEAGKRILHGEDY